MRRLVLFLAVFATLSVGTCLAQTSNKRWISVESAQTARSGERPVVTLQTAGIKQLTLRAYRVGDPLRILKEVMGKGSAKSASSAPTPVRIVRHDDPGKSVEPLDKRIPYLKENVTFVAERQVTLKPDNDRLRNWWRRTEEEGSHKTAYYYKEGVRVPVSEPGLYLVEAMSDDVRSYTLVFVSDIVLFARTAGAKLHVFTANRNTGAPVAGCNIYVVSTRQLLARTDQQGLAELNFRGDNDTLLVAVRGNHVAAIKNIYRASAGEQRSGYVYTDRPIYRPGDTVHFKGLFRTRSGNNWDVPRNVPLKLTITDPRSDTIFERELLTSSMGTSFGDFELPADAKLGQYHISIEPKRTALDDKKRNRQTPTPDYFDWSNRLFGSAWFEVQEYKKPELEVKVTTDKERIVQGENLKATISARYYFGSQVKAAKVDYAVYASEWAYNPDEVTEYSGSASLMGRGYSSLAKGSAVLDDNGRFTFPIISAAALSKRDQIILIQARVADEAGRIITGQTRALSSYGMFRLRTSQKQWGYYKGDSASFEVMAADYDGHPVATDFKAEISRYDGEKHKYVALSSLEGKTDEAGKGSLSIKLDDPGDYIAEITAKDSNGREIKASAWMYVWGGERNMYSFSRSDSVLVMADKKKYEPGDTARLMFISEKPNLHYFVTIEAGTTTKSYKVDATGTTGELALPITGEFAPNFFVHAIAAQGGSTYGVETYEPPSFTVALTEQQLFIEVQPSKGQFEPGDDATVKIRTASRSGKPVSAELSLGVVDASIYALREDKTPDILSRFYPHRSQHTRGYDSLAFTFSDTAGQGVPPYGLGGVPGGVPGGLPGGMLLGDRGPTSADAFVEPRVRKEFPDTAHWVANVQTDANGQAEVRFRVPDTLTTWRTTARGITEDTKVGSTVNDVVSRKNVLLRMSAPRFLRTGDEVTISAFVHNYLPSAKKTRVSLSVEGLEIISGETKDVEIPSDGDSQVDWVVRAGSVGNAKFTAKALTNEESDAVESTIPVHPLGTRVRIGSSGILSDQTASHVQSITFPESSAPQTRKIAIQLSPSIAAAALKSLDYLTSYPYGCTEQTMSSFVPNIVVAGVIRQLGVKADVDEAKLRKKVTKGLALLYKNQHASGGWGWWPDDSDLPFMTAYVVAGLSQARDAGYKVNADALSRGRKWLVDNFDMRVNADLRAYMLYAITLDKPDRKLLDQEWEDRRFLGLYGKLLFGLALQQAGDSRSAQLVSDVENSAQTTPHQAHWQATADPLMELPGENDIEVTALAVQFLARQSPNSDLLPRAVSWLMQQKDGGEYWRSTKQTAMVLNGLTAYLKQTRELQSGAQADVYLNGSKIGSYEVTNGSKLDRTVSVQLDASRFLPTNELRLEKKGAGTVYWSVVPEYFSVTETRHSKGLEIKREYFKLQRARLDSSWSSLMALLKIGDSYNSEPLSGPVQRGDILAVKVTVAGNEWKYLMVEDPIPAGTEIIDSAQSLYRSFGYVPYYVGHEYRDDRASFFRTSLLGSGQFVYFLRVVNPGKFGISPASAENMYQPDIYSATQVETMTVN